MRVRDPLRRGAALKLVGLQTRPEVKLVAAAARARSTATVKPSSAPPPGSNASLARQVRAAVDAAAEEGERKLGERARQRALGAERNARQAVRDMLQLLPAAVEEELKEYERVSKACYVLFVPSSATTAAMDDYGPAQVNVYVLHGNASGDLFHVSSIAPSASAPPLRKEYLHQALAMDDTGWQAVLKELEGIKCSFTVSTEPLVPYAGVFLASRKSLVQISW